MCARSRCWRERGPESASAASSLSHARGRVMRDWPRGADPAVGVRDDTAACPFPPHHVLLVVSRIRSASLPTEVKDVVASFAQLMWDQNSAVLGQNDLCYCAVTFRDQIGNRSQRTANGYPYLGGSSVYIYRKFSIDCLVWPDGSETGMNISCLQLVGKLWIICRQVVDNSQTKRLRFKGFR